MAECADCTILHAHFPRKPRGFPPDENMATPVKTAQGTWRIQIEINGKRKSKTLPTRREVVAWALEAEHELRDDKKTTRFTLQDALDKYHDEVSETHRGWRKEQIRLKAFPKQPFFPEKKLAHEVTVEDLGRWRDARLKVNARGSVLRDMGLLSAVLEETRRVWKWIQVNPMLDVKKPAEPDHREVLITGPQIRRMLRALKYSDGPVRSVSHAVAMAFLLALSTGMRAGEITSLEWKDVHRDYLQLHMTKNGSARQVPLSTVGKRVIERMKGWDEKIVFGITAQSRDAIFRKYRERAGLSGFTFHDARHSAATRIGSSGRIQLLEMCRIFGWKNPKQALRYFNMTAKDLARKLG